MLNGAAITSPSTDWRLEIPPELIGSRLLANRGFLVVSGWVAPVIVGGLLAEAFSVKPQSTRNLVTASDGAEGRGGSPARAYRSASAGPVHWGLHASRELVEALTSLCGVPVTTTGGGTYSYYERPGDFLALHRDVLTCDVAMITCLTPGADVSAGGLLVYPDALDKPLSQVRAAGRSTGTRVPLGWGDTVILLGGILPHEVTPMSGATERIVAVMCYRMDGGSDQAAS